MEAEADTKVVDRESTAGEVQPAPNEDLHVVHRLVGRYELVHRLGHGGMATVYLGRAIAKAGFERLVAVKVIHPHLADEPDFVEMFLDEARIAAKIHHPHVVEILDVGDDDDLTFMVMEYVEGDTLSSLIRQLRRADEFLPTLAVLQVIADAAAGLAAAHDLIDTDGNPLGLVHRDVSPHNLLVSMDGRVKVVDFGIMKAAGKRSSTLTGQLRGKIAYMSPEQARARPVDRRTDIFALGAVFWELCTNARLFAADSEAETLDRVLNCEVPDILELRPDLPDDVAHIIGRALAEDADDRYRDAHEFLRDVRAAMRRMTADADPREVLAVSMTRFFAGRIEYVRNSLRGRAANDRTRRSSSDSIRGPAMAASARFLDEGGLGRTPSSARLTPSSPSASLSRGSATTTTMVGAGRQWPLWLVLPLIGAAIATIALGWRRAEQAAVPRPTSVAVVEPKAPAAEAAVGAPVKVPHEDLVTWWFNTKPQGATVLVDGKAHDVPTPMALKLPRSENAVEVRIEKAGFETFVAKMAPVAGDNHMYELKPLPKEPAAVNPKIKAKHPHRRTRKKARPPKKIEPSPPVVVPAPAAPAPAPAPVRKASGLAPRPKFRETSSTASETD